jgi:hypothetical protein
METDPADKDQWRPRQRRGLSLSERVLFVACAVFFLGFGLKVIVTREMSAGRGFSGGPVTLDPISAWYVGLTMILGGGLVLPLGYIAITRRRQKEQRAKDAATIAALTSRGMSRAGAQYRIDDARREKQKAVRQRGIRFVLIGVALMVAGSAWAIAAIFWWHNMIMVLLGAAVAVVGKFQFFWPGIIRTAIGRRYVDEVQ